MDEASKKDPKDYSTVIGVAAIAVLLIGMGTAFSLLFGLLWGIGISSAVLVFGVLFLNGLEYGNLALWKFRRCNSCHKHYSYSGWDLDSWRNTYWCHQDSWICIKCPHCGELRKVEKPVLRH